MTEYLDFTGTLKYCQYIRRTEEFRGTKAWKVTVELDEESLKKFEGLKARGLALKIRNDNQVQFKCNESKMINGELTMFDQPTVKKWDEDSSTFVDFPDSIGDGTVAKVNVEFYEYNNSFGQGMGHRLRGLTILNHVPYERQDGTVGQPQNDATPATSEKPW